MAYKPLTIKAKTYERLKNFRDSKGWTFSRAIEELLDRLEEAENGGTE